MKKIFTLLCCIGGTALFAQNTSSVSATEEAPNWPVMLVNLPITQITSGILLDKVVDYSNITNFNTADKNLSDSNHFAQALNELYRASDQTKFISTITLNSRTAYSTNANNVDVGIINTLFHRLNFNEDDATLTGVTYNGTQFSTVSGKPTFVSKKVLIASPLKEIVSGSSINFNFNDTFVFTNSTTAIKKLTVKFEENTTNAPVTIINNSAYILYTKNITYTTSGYKTLEFTATFSDNTTITTFGKIYVNVTANLTTALVSGSTTTTDLCTETLRERGVYPSTTAEIANTVAFQGYDETYAIKGQIEYTAFYSYSNTAKKMLKPIIIVDGFDPKDKRKVQDCDCENDPTCKLANSDISFNWGSIPHVQITFNPTKHVSIEDSMIYNDANQQPTNLMSELRTLGYDVIIVNQPTYQIVDPVSPTIQVWVPTGVFSGHFESRPNIRTIDGGADYIERNALTLVSFIQSIKTKQTTAGSTEGLVLIGPSMGGQITRYALAYMEKKFAETGNTIWKHNARLWISVDSPHLGANIPVGAQANIWFMADRLSKDTAQKSYDDLNSIAGKQQSIINFEYARTSSAHNLQGSPFFTTYYNNLNSNGVAGSNGYPVSTPTFRKIAMINGSLTGTKQGSEGQSFLYTRIYIRGLWPFQSSTITLARFHDSFMSSYGSTGQVFQGDGQNFSIGLNHWTINHPRYTLNVNNQDIRGSLDVVPGGYFKIGEILKNSIEGGASDAGYRSETTDYVASNSFIAAFSALGHLNPLQNWSNPLNTNLACSSNKQTPFDSYWGSNTNTEHTSFTKESADWLKKELAGNKQAPYFPLQANLITGVDFLCGTSNSVYSISDMCKVPSSLIYIDQNGATVNGWSVSSNLQIVSSTGTSITVSGITNGQGVITATFQNGQTITKKVWIGKPKITIYQYPISNCSTFLEIKSTLPTTTLVEQGITSVTWTQNGEVITGNTFNFAGIYSPIVLSATNSCGTTTLSPYIPLHLPLSCPPAPLKMSNLNNNDTSFYNIYPNPSNDIINIDLRDSNNQPEKGATISGELFDMMEQSKSKVEIIDNKAIFSVRGLEKGIYVLKIYINDQVETHQIAVE